MNSVQQQLRRAGELLAIGDFVTAGSIFESLVESNPDCAEAHYGLSLTAASNQKIGRAAIHAENATNLNPVEIRYLEHRAGLFLRLDRRTDALETHLKIVELNPLAIRSLCVAGLIYDSICQFDEAIDSFSHALKVSPHDIESTIGLGFAFLHKDQPRDAEKYFRKAIEIGEESFRSYSGLALSLLGNGALDDAIRYFGHAEEAFLKSVRLPSPNTKLKFSRILHEKEQLDFLSLKGLLANEHHQYYENLKTLISKFAYLHRPGENVSVTCTADEILGITPMFKKIIYKSDGSRVDGTSINPNLDVERIQSDYHGSTPAIIFIDDFLTDEALTKLYEYCITSNIFKKGYGAGYVGSMLAEGFASPLLLQISEELRLRFPKIFGNSRLTQAWAYKYDSKFKGIRTHADAAKINVNFWISPDEGNLNPDSGGLIVWDKVSPDDWSFADYNKNDEKMQDFLRSSGANEIKVPFRQNRALIFNSGLFHRTDDITFKDEYVNRRINVTLLYGMGLRS